MSEEGKRVWKAYETLFVDGNDFEKIGEDYAVTAWLVRYNANLIFCKEETSGRLIREILYRDLKERLENGEYG